MQDNASTQPSAPRFKRKCAEFLVVKNGKNAGKTIAKFRGSSFGGCIHSHVACLRGLEEGDVPQHMQGIFDRGHAAEAWAKERLTAQGVKWIDAGCGLEEQRDQELTLWGDDPASGRMILISITPDGLSVDKRDPENALVNAEFKSFARKSYQEFLRDGIEGNERYAYQVSAEVHGYRRKHRGKRVSGCIVPIIAENNRDWSEGAPESVPRWFFELGEILKFDEPPFTEEQCLQRCRDVLAAYDAGEWPECDSKYPCRYPHTSAVVADVEVEATVARYERAVQEWIAASKELEACIAGAEFVGSRKITRYQSQMVALS